MNGRLRRALVTLPLVLACLAAAGCGQKEAPVAGPTVVMEDQWTVKGKVVSVGEKGVTIDHQDIPGLMPAMTMAFAVKEPAVLQGVAEGDAVEFTLVRSADGLHVTRIQRINPAELEAGKEPKK